MKKIYLSILGAVGMATTALAQPLNAPTTPPARDAGDVISIYSEAYTSASVVNFFPNWGQTTVVSTETIAGNEIKKMSAFNYQGIEFNANLNVSSMETVHIDLWSADCTEMDFYLIANGSGEKPKRLTIANGWNSYDIPLSFYSEAPGLELPLDKIFQFKLVAITPATGSTVYYDNIYFYKSASTPTITGFSIPTKLTTDGDFVITPPTSNSLGAFTYASSNTSVATISGSTIHIVGAGTTTVTVNQAADGAYNAGSATATFVVNYPPPTDAPTTPPARNPANVLAIYSEAYTNLTGLDFNPGWGQSTAISEQTYSGNAVQRMLKFNYQGLLLGTDLDVSGMEKLHLDLWTPDCSSFEVSLIYKLTAGGQAEKKVVLTPTLNGWNSFDIPLSDYTTQDVNVNLTQVFQIKFEATGWTPTTTKTVFYDNLYFYAGGTLPVSLTNFNTKVQPNEVALTWQTVSENNNKGFSVERSQNGTKWQQIAFVNGNNNSSSVNNYSYADKNPAQGINYYRLVQVDNNGNKANPSAVKSVNFRVALTEKINAYPNPASDKLYVQLGAINNQNATITLVSLKGNTVKSIKINPSNSNTAFGLSVADLSSGIYLLVVEDGNAVQSTKIVIK